MTPLSDDINEKDTEKIKLNYYKSISSENKIYNKVLIPLTGNKTAKDFKEARKKRNDLKKDEGSESDLEGPDTDIKSNRN